MLPMLIVSACGTAAAQGVPTRALGTPNAVYAEPFSRVGGVREQSDGRVVVLDVRDIRIVRIDFRDGSSQPLGRTGRGPGEYTLPHFLVPLPGDTSLAVDMSGGGRALVVTRDGVASSAIRSVGFERGQPLFHTDNILSDARGRLYELVARRASGAGAQQPPSWGVRRLDRQTGRQDTLASISRQVRSPLIRPVTSQRGGNSGDPQRAAGGAPPPFMTVDQWTVAPDGRIAVVTVEPYQVTYVSEDGMPLVGKPIVYTPVRVNSALKQQWRELKSQPVLTIRSGPNGSISGGSTKPRFAEPDVWPEVLPPFLLDAVRFAPDGTLWIERTAAAGSPQTFDLVDRAGSLASRVVLPPKTRLVGFGEHTIYVVKIDADDLEYLQRHARP
jgi:hypothetical protein